MTTKKPYEKPSSKVYVLRQQPQLLVGSSGGGSLNDYQWNDPTDE